MPLHLRWHNIVQHGASSRLQVGHEVFSAEAKHSSIHQHSVFLEAKLFVHRRSQSDADARLRTVWQRLDRVVSQGLLPLQMAWAGGLCLVAKQALKNSRFATVCGSGVATSDARSEYLARLRSGKSRADEQHKLLSSHWLFKCFLFSKVFRSS